MSVRLISALLVSAAVHAAVFVEVDELLVPGAGGARPAIFAVSVELGALPGSAPDTGDTVSEQRVPEMKDRLTGPASASISEPTTLSPGDSSVGVGDGVMEGESEAAPVRERAPGTSMAAAQPAGGAGEESGPPRGTVSRHVISRHVVAGQPVPGPRAAAPSEVVSPEPVLPSATPRPESAWMDGRGAPPSAMTASFGADDRAAVAPSPVRVAMAGGASARELLTEPPVGDALDARFFELVHAAIEARKRYPRRARRRGWEGRAVVEFTLYPDGAVSSVRVVEGSGHEPLDAAAREAVEAIAPLAGTADFLTDRRTLNLGIDFRLR
ncbi:MAG: energy transducer TonB family protein [Gammaproteobacteria bacterium]